MTQYETWYRSIKEGKAIAIFLNRITILLFSIEDGYLVGNILNEDDGKCTRGKFDESLNRISIIPKPNKSL